MILTAEQALAIAIEAIHFHRKACQDLEQYGRMDTHDRKAVLDRIFDNLEEVDGEREAEQVLLDLAAGSHLTAEQREALKTVDALLWKHASEPGIQRIGQILYDLRTNAKPAWEITEERKTAIEYAISVIEQSDTELEDSISIDLFRAMLEEDLRSKKRN